MQLKRIRQIAVATLATVFGATLQAQVVSYVGFDAGANAPSVNSLAARNSFVTATGGTVGATFESSVLPAGLSITGGSRKTTPRGDPFSLFGGNTTLGGSGFWDLYEFGATRFDFTSPINFFGAFLGGQQIQGSYLRVFTESSTDIPIIVSTSGGAGFYGFTSVAGINRVDVFIQSDYVSLDDLYFGSIANTMVPEPVTYSLLAAGLAAVGLVSRRRRRRTV